jgi:hypothetical protein
MKVRKRNTGQAMTEYCIICVMLFGGFFLGEPSLAQSLTNAIKSFYSTFAFFFSLS